MAMTQHIQPLSSAASGPRLGPTGWPWPAGRCSCSAASRKRGARARLLVDLGAGFSSDDAPRRYHASLQARRWRCC
jgi:hypothetical protein